jgi:hypothetical protein
MWGPPKDVEGECNARLHIGDDYGDNRATMRCHLPEGHEGDHREKYLFDEEDPKAAHNVTITWAGCDRAWEEAMDAEDEEALAAEDEERPPPWVLWSEEEKAAWLAAGEKKEDEDDV